MKKLIIGLTVGMLLGSSTVALAATNTVQATLTKFRVAINGVPKTGTSTQLLYKGTTYVPIRDLATMFNYTTNFDNNSKAISFTSADNSNDAWITLYDFQAANDYLTVQQQQGISNAYEVLSGGATLFKVNGSEMKDGDYSAITDNKNKQIKIEKVLGAIYLNKQDLKDAGYRVK